jgi:hypothetical protein
MVTWMPVVFWILLIPLLVVLLFTYIRGKKLHRLAYILAVFTYTMTIMYWIDAFNLGRNVIISMLLFSSILMIFVGYLMHRKTMIRSRKQNAAFAIASMVLIFLLIIVSALPIGMNVTEQTVESVQRDQIIRLSDSGFMGQQGIDVHEITLTSTFMPRRYVLPGVNVCMYNSVDQSVVDMHAQWQTRDFGNYIEAYREPQSVSLQLFPHYRFAPTPEAGNQTFEEYDQVLLYFHDEQWRWVACLDLIQDIDDAIVIPIVD